MDINLKDRITVYWDIRATSYGQMRHKHLHGREFQFWQAEMKAVLPSSDRPLKVLDVGTATGFMAIVCTSLGHKVTAVDISRHMLQRARAAASEFGYSLTFLQMYAHQMDFPSGSFDVVICRNTIWTVLDPRRVYMEIFRVLKPGGCFFNCDADYGRDAFKGLGATPDEKALFAECHAYTSLLPISYVQRPEWDIATLRNLGFVHCECIRNISGRLNPHGSSKSSDSHPLFSIFTVKPACPEELEDTDYDFQLFKAHNQLFYREQRQFGNNKDTEYLILDLLMYQPEGLRPSDLSEYIFIPKQTVTRILAQLAAKGYIRQMPNPRDRRSMLLTLTPEGQKQHRREEQALEVRYAKVLSSFPSQKLSQLNQLYMEFLDAFPTT